jgi:hypothetical protein
MRLLNTTSLQLKTFDENDALEYGILSHTWGSDEVGFKDIMYMEDAEKQSGFMKILGSCQQASACGLNWVWVDICCIDKRSSAALS